MSEDHVIFYDTGYVTVLESAIEKPTLEAVRQSQKETRFELTRSQREINEKIRQSNELYHSLSSKLLKKNQQAFEQSQKETEVKLRQSHERCLSLSTKLRKKIQDAIIEFHKINSTSDCNQVLRSQAIQKVIDIVIATDAVLRLFVEDETEQLKTLLNTTTLQLKILQETENQKQSILQDIGSKQSWIIEESERLS